MAESDKRLLYYNGQFLQEQDFTDEQQYHLDRQRRHNRLLHSHGIADGLAVTGEIGARHVTVHPGTAIDKQGRAIVLTELRNVAFEEAASGDLLVVIAYSEEPSDPATSGDPGNTRWLERPQVQVLPEAEALAEDVQIRLARLHLDEDGTLAEHDKTVRRSAGKLGVGTLEVQKPIGDAAQFIQDQNGNESSLAIGAGKVGVGTEDLTCAFTVAGDASGPTVEVRSTGNDASIRYAKSDGSGVWHAGVGPMNNFYFWNQESNASAVFTPEGTLIANNVATPDERDIKADRSTLDALALATIKGVSNAGGDIDVVGENGISISGDNQAKSITIANAAGSLAVGNVLGAQPQPVLDAKGNPSALSIGSESVEIKTDKVRSLVATVAGNVPAAPLMELRNKDNEASIRYVNEKEGSVAWHAGVGGNGGLENFFFWNETKGVVATIEPDGTLTTNGGFNVGSGTKDKGVLTVQGDAPAPLVEVLNKREEALIKFLNSDNEAWHIGTGGLGGPKNFALWNQTNGIVVTIMPDGSMVPRGTLYVGSGTKNKVALTAESDTPGPTVEVRNKQEEATIRYVDNNNVAWHVGTSGAGGAKNFFFWNSKNGTVATITPEGTLTIKGDLVVDGGLSMRRTVVMASFSQADADGTIKTVETGFQPKFISMEGRSHAWLGTANAHLSYGGAVGGFCQVSDSGDVVRIAGHGPHVSRIAEPPYLIFYNEVYPAQYKTFGSTGFVDHVADPKLHVYLEVSVESITSTGFKLKLFRKTDPGFTLPSVFSVDMAFAVLG